ALVVKAWAYNSLERIEASFMEKFIPLQKKRLVPSFCHCAELKKLTVITFNFCIQKLDLSILGFLGERSREHSEEHLGEHL
ncbi:13685_t:CDS:2, partial [Dentiscutata erythropus]